MGEDVKPGPLQLLLAELAVVLELVPVG